MNMGSTDMDIINWWQMVEGAQGRRQAGGDAHAPSLLADRHYSKAVLVLHMVDVIQTF
jgi:hypothetical protein